MHVIGAPDCDDVDIGETNENCGQRPRHRGKVLDAKIAELPKSVIVSKHVGDTIHYFLKKITANYVFLSGFKFRSLLDMMFSGVNGTSHFKLHYLMVGTFTVFLFLTERAACGVSLLECLLNAVQQYKE